MTEEQRPSGCLAALFGIRAHAVEDEYDEAPVEVATEGPSVLETKPYRVVGEALSPAELHFYNVLQPLTRKYILCIKVRVADVLRVAVAEGKTGWFNRINAKHVDFLICEKETARPLIAVELDDASHNRSDRKKRDKFLDEAFASAGLALVRFRARASYDPQEVAEKLKEAFKS